MRDILLRDGSVTYDRRLDRLVQFDEQSRDYPIRTLVADKPLRSYTWSVGQWLDQGSEGACTGFCGGHEALARPVVQTGIDNQYARERIYWEAQKIDPWPGGAYPGASPFMEGSSVLAAAKVMQALGHFAEYRWAFGLNDLALAIGYAGPAMLGINWYEGMFKPEPDGRIRPTGRLMGGHAILAFRVWIATATRPIPQIWLHNSWGWDWGREGRCWLSFDDMARLLDEDGEACIPMRRALVA